MKLTVKTLAGKQLPIEVEESLSVAELKLKIESEHALKAETLKLIAYGKVLDSDAKAITDYGIKDGDFIVAMQQKAKPAPKPKPPAAEPKPETQASTAPATSAQQPATSSMPVQPPNPQPAAQTNQSQPAASNVSNVQLPPQIEQAVTELIAISGKPREDCIRALAMAQNQPDLAFEILLQGLPSDEDMAALGDYGDEQPDANPTGNVGGGVNPAAGLTPQVVQQLQALVNNPGFPAIRQRLLTDQDFTAMFMSNLQQQQPDIYAAIQANPQILVMLLQGAVPQGGSMSMPGAGAGAGQQQLPPGTIQVSQEESEAIKRLENLGFSRVRAAEAYFACDKNEEQAANFLFESGMEDESSAMQQAIAESQQMSNPNPPAADNQAQPAQQQEQPAAAEGGEQQQQQQQDANAQSNQNSGGDNQQPPPEGGSGEGGAGSGGNGGSSLL